MDAQSIATITECHIKGIPQGQIAERIGCTRETVNRNLKREEIQTLIREGQQRLINSSLNTAIDNQAAKIKAAHNIISRAEGGEEITRGQELLTTLGQRCEEKLLESVGIHPSHTQSITLNQILIDARQEMSPVVEAMLLRHMAADVIEITATT